MKIRILYCIETLKSGGVERRRLTLTKLLPREKFEVKLVCTQSIGPLADEIRSEGVEVIEVGLLSKVWYISRYKAVLKIINDFKPHIIHGAVFEGVLLSTIAGKLGRVPVIIAEETSVPINRSKKAVFLLKALVSLSDKIVAVSPAVENYLIDQIGVAKVKVKLINNGVYSSSFADKLTLNNLKNELKIKDGELVIGSVGRLWNEVKRFTDLIEAFSKINIKYSNLKLLIVGDGPDRQLIDKLVEEKELQEKVVMAGFQHDTQPYFQLMDIFAIVSQTESFGLVAVEAMLNKLPVIASRVGGLKDIVIDNETGLIVDPRSPEQIAGALVKLLDDKSMVSCMGERGYQRAIKEYSAERYVKEVKNLYDELLRQKQII